MAKVLIATPTSKRHEYCIDEFLDRLRNQTHPVHLLLYDNTLDRGGYFKRLQDKTSEPWIKVKRYEWKPKLLAPVQMLAYVKEDMRKYFLTNGFTHYFDLASDMFLKENDVKRLLEHDRDVVGAVTHIFFGKDKMPAIIKWRGSVKKSGFISNEGGLDLMPWKEVDKLHGLHRVWGANPALIKRKVLKKCHFRTHPTLIMGEDLWFFTEVNEKGFEWWCDTDLKVEHRNIDWSGIPNPHSMSIFFAMQPLDFKPKGVEFYTGARKANKKVKRK